MSTIGRDWPDTVRNSPSLVDGNIDVARSLCVTEGGVVETTIGQDVVKAETISEMIMLRAAQMQKPPQGRARAFRSSKTYHSSEQLRVFKRVTSINALLRDKFLHRHENRSAIQDGYPFGVLKPWLSTLHPIRQMCRLICLWTFAQVSRNIQPC